MSHANDKGIKLQMGGGGQKIVKHRNKKASIYPTEWRKNPYMQPAGEEKRGSYRRKKVGSVSSEENHTAVGSFDRKGEEVSGWSCEVEKILEYESDQRCDDRKVVDKNAILQFALSQLVVDFDRESNLSMRRFFSKRHAHVIPTGSLKLDEALGIGGIPKPRNFLADNRRRTSRSLWCSRLLIPSVCCCSALPPPASRSPDRNQLCERKHESRRREGSSSFVSPVTTPPAGLQSSTALGVSILAYFSDKIIWAHPPLLQEVDGNSYFRRAGPSQSVGLTVGRRGGMPAVRCVVRLSTSLRRESMRSRLSRICWSRSGSTMGGGGGNRRRGTLFGVARRRSVFRWSAEACGTAGRASRKSGSRNYGEKCGIWEIERGKDKKVKSEIYF
ncbi:hypothetical protein KSP40_PGU022067 [Platanthera guangdongensis]|uniref:Uncharacterized protein n=1 Tax=Platanthera guangdongensis TaxID=2320717 RepID=A0ABR2MD64_9ASPA